MNYKSFFSLYNHTDQFSVIPHAMGKKSKGKARPAAPTAAEEAGFKAAQDLQAEAGRKGLDAFREISSPAAAARDAMAAGLMSPNPLGDPTDTRRAQRQYLSTIMDVGLNERDTHGNGDQSHLIAGMPSDPAFQSCATSGPRGSTTTRSTHRTATRRSVPRAGAAFCTAALASPS